MHRFLAESGAETLERDVDIEWIDLDRVAAPARALGSDQRRARSGPAHR